METPDITKAQIVAILQPILAVAVAFGAPLSDAQQASILGLSGVIATVLVLADALIRRGRAGVEAARVAEKPYDSVVGP